MLRPVTMPTYVPETDNASYLQCYAIAEKYAQQYYQTNYDSRVRKIIDANVHLSMLFVALTNPSKRKYFVLSQHDKIEPFVGLLAEDERDTFVRCYQDLLTTLLVS